MKEPKFRIKEKSMSDGFGYREYWWEVQKLKEFLFFSWWKKVSGGRQFKNFEAAEEFLKDFVSGKIKPKSNCIWYDEQGERMS